MNISHLEQNLSERFVSDWQTVGAATNPRSIFRFLADAHNEPGRSYHTLEHVASSQFLLDLRQVALLCTNLPALRIATYFHDAVYLPGSKTNEAKSAFWASAFLKQAYVNPKMITVVNELIMSTTHKEPGQTRDERVMQDVDLAILGSHPDTYNRYRQAIRNEYRAMPPDEYRYGRVSVLENFLDRRMIYTTPYFHGRFERQARENLQNERKTLRLVTRVFGG